MSDLGFNKIAGAVLATGLAIVGLNIFSEEFLFPAEHATKPGYAIDIPEAAGGGEPAGPVLPPDWGTVLPTADIAAGQAQFAKCASCHKPDDTNGTGPGLNAILGRKPGAHVGFEMKYSEPMKAFGAANPRWDYDHINDFVAAPQKYMPGTKMTFIGIKKPEDRIALMAYLHSLNSTLPIPAPDPSRQAPAEGAAPAEGEAPAEGATPAADAAGAPAAAAAPAAAH